MLLDSSPALPRHSKFLRLIHDRNPFYLLSALCMFMGFRIVLGALNSAPADWKKLLLLIATLHLYELVMVGLALFLIVKRGLQRDGWILLGLEALFLVDLTNLNAELFTALPRLGSVVNAICFLLAIIKIFVIVRTLGLRLSPGTTFYIAAQLAFMFGLPGIFYLLRSSTATVSAMQIYSVWWMLALLVASGSLLIKRINTADVPMASLPWRLYIVVPLISLMVHLASENRVFWVHFHSANIAPLLLASVFALSRSKYRWSPGAMGWSISLMTMALIASISPREFQHDLSTHLFGILISPLRIALLASTGLSIFLAIRRYSMFAANIAVAYGISAWLGATPGQILKHGLRIARSSLELSGELVPDTTLEWGYVAIVSSFVLLGVGAMFSLKKLPPPLTETAASAFSE